MIKFYCSSCGQGIQVYDKYAGRQFKCPKCLEVNTAPNISEAAVGQAGIPVADIALGASGHDITGQRGFYYAGFWLRFVASVIDSLVLMAGGLVVGAIVGFAMGTVLGAAGTDMPTIQSVCGAVGYMIGIILNWLYYTLFECSSRQATLGKMALGIIVTDMDGNRISFGRANGRYWGKIISGLTLGIGYIMAGFTERKQALHDMMAGCLVVKK
jgi:uncharacterized RDD family membrane protein YckC